MSKRKPKPLPPPRPHVRCMIRRDMPDVLDIEAKSFEFPWSEDDFIRCLRQRNCIGMVAEIDGGRVAGLMIYELNKTILRFLNFAVHPDFRRQGIGSAMLDKVKGTIDPDCGRDGAKQVRQVEIQDDHLQWQVSRYDSGLYVSLTPAQFEKLKSASWYTPKAGKAETLARKLSLSVAVPVSVLFPAIGSALRVDFTPIAL